MNCELRRRGWRTSAPLVALMLAGCAAAPPEKIAPLAAPRAILRPDAGLGIDASSTDVFRGGVNLRDDAFKITQAGGKPIIEVTAPGGTVAGRRLAIPLLAAPRLRWSWYLDPTVFGGGAGDGLDRGLRIVVGFYDANRWWPSFDVFGDYPSHDRRIELVLGGVGGHRSEVASQTLYAISDGGQRRVLRAAAGDAAGRWHVEGVDLAQIYAAFWPGSRLDRVEVRFVGLGGLPGQVPSEAGSTIGYVAEILLAP